MSVFASLPDAIALTDRDGRIMTLNAAAERLFAVAETDVRGRDAIASFVAPSEHARARALLAELAAGQAVPTGVHMCLRRADGTSFDGEISPAAVAGSEGIVVLIRDITARLAAEADTARLRAIVGAAHEAIIGIDNRDTIEFFSPSAERLFGWSAGEIIGRSISTLSGEFRAEVLAGVRAALARGEPARVEMVAQRRDGSHVEVEVGASPIVDADGRRRGTALTVLDVSERRRTQRMLDRIIEYAPTSIAVKGLDGRYLVYNERGAAALGLRPEEILGRGDDEVFGAEIAERLVKQDREVAECGAPKTFDDTLIGADGSARQYLTTKFPLPGADGAVEAIGLIAADVTESRRAEADQAQLAALVQAAPDAIVARDRDGRIVTWNPGAEIMFGRSAADAIGRLHDDLLVPESERETAAAVLAQVQAGRTLTVHTQRLRADGSRFPAQVSMAPLTLLDGIWQGTLAMVRDITDLVEAERELQERAAQLERSNADLERFAYAASHDLQAPLQSIRLSAGAVIAAAEGRLDPDERELMQHIDVAAQRLSGQIRGLMEVAQVALGAAPGAWVRVVVAVRDAVDALRAAADEAGARISVGELPAVDVPHTEVALVVQNLIANAIKYRREDVAPEIAISAVADGHAVELRVTDNGIGLSEDDLNRVFGFFERGPSSAPGTGMGLAVARRMLERYDGTLTATSAGRGQGSVFILRLPLRG